MLVLSRKSKQTVVLKASGKAVLSGDITIAIEKIRGNVVSISINAPDEVKILRGELTHEKPKSE
jgi:carbon storage regulator CsrA